MAAPANRRPDPGRSALAPGASGGVTQSRARRLHDFFDGGDAFAACRHRSEIQFSDQYFDADLVVGSNGLQDAAEQRSGFQRTMVRHRHMMHAIDVCCQPDVRTFLPHGLIAELTQGADKVGAIYVSRDFQTASASSRTK